jgi:hypothetical protein
MHVNLSELGLRAALHALKPFSHMKDVYLRKMSILVIKYLINNI